jgi:hypothetical protein
VACGASWDLRRPSVLVVQLVRGNATHFAVGRGLQCELSVLQFQQLNAGTSEEVATLWGAFACSASRVVMPNCEKTERVVEA